MNGLILFAHGARDARWAAPFEAVARQIRQHSEQLPLRLAYLEFMTPNLDQAAAELCRAGCRSVSVLPLFLGTGGHLRSDLPPMLERLRTTHAPVQFTLHSAVGEHPAVIQAMAAAALELLAQDDAAPARGET